MLVEVDAHHALRIAEKVRSHMEKESMLLDNGSEQKVTVSIGIAIFDGHPDPQNLINRADAAMYQAKQSGRNRCVIDSTTTE